MKKRANKQESKLRTSSRVIQAINRIPGSKIVTLISPNSLNPVMKIDVHEESWGYEPGHKELFAAKLASATSEGSMLVRQFLEDTFTDDRGRVLPRKILYGAFFRNDEIHPTPPDQLRICCNTDADTGEPIPEEQGVEYGDFGKWLT